MRQALHDISTPKLRAKYWKDVTKFLKSLSHGELYLQKAIEYGKIKEIQYLGDWKYRNVK